VAAVRIGQAQAESGDLAAARASLRAAASSNGSRRVAEVVARALASQVSAALGDFDAEVTDLKRTLEAWDPDFGATLQFASNRSPTSGTAPDVLATSFRREDMSARAVALAASLARPGGKTLEAGRWRLQHADWNGALAILEPVSRATASPLAGEARALAHRARLERALEMADPSGATRDEEGADRALKALAAEPFDFSVAAASVSRAALGWTQGLQGDARLWMRDGLEALRANQPIVPAPLTGTLAADVLAIRDVVFRPLGGGLYPAHWNGFDFPAALPRYLLSQSTVQVRLPGGRSEMIAVNRPPPGLTNVLFFDADQEAFLTTLMRRLGGTATRQPGSPIETPNQPVGRSVNILAMFTEFFPARPGHWGGWEFFAYPVISSIEFRDEARTKAVVAVVIGYAGANVIFEKRDGVWVATLLTNAWVT
jgi:hypothetical protein